ncbi:putative Guanylate cyclase:CHASE2 [Rhodospirillaceae bacterium LM-1]|nr:putative Guanylate cyclase:CHASE2 [Rhodospirillaceae bacterium LM-1]
MPNNQNGSTVNFLQNSIVKGAGALVGVALLATTLSVLGMQGLPVLTLLGSWIDDFRIATLLPNEPKQPDIVLVTITEDTLANFQYRSPIDRKFLSNLLQELDRREVRAIGLDILLDQPTEPEKDNQLYQTLRNIKSPLVISYAREEETLNQNQVAFLDYYVPYELRGFSNLVKDPLDGTARWIYEGRALPDGRFVLGFSAALAQKLGYAVPGKEVHIAWHGSPDSNSLPFTSFPAHSISLLPTAWFKNKIVLIGSDLPLTDRHRTPFSTRHQISSSQSPGVAIHAHALAQLLDGRSSPYPTFSFVVSATFIAALVGAGLGYIGAGLVIRVGMATVSISVLWLSGFMLFHKTGFLLPLAGPSLALALALWASDVYSRRKEREQRRFIKNAFALYVAPEVVNELVIHPETLALGGERRMLSYIFTDLADFTTLSETIPPHELAEILNQYLEEMCSILFKHGGTVNDFIGDAIFAMFNAPKFQEDHAKRALACALDMDLFSEAFRKTIHSTKGIQLGVTRIGIHSGEAIVGNFGSKKRFKYTPIGDPVNTASRIEGLNKYFGTRLCTTENTLAFYAKTPSRPLGRIIVKGKSQPLAVFEILTPEQAESSYFTRFREAYALLDAKDSGALLALQALANENPADGCVALHIKRLQAGETGSLVQMSSK